MIERSLKEAAGPPELPRSGHTSASEHCSAPTRAASSPAPSRKTPPLPLAPHRRAVAILPSIPPSMLAAAGFAQSKGAHGRTPGAQVARSAVALDAGLGRISSASRNADSSSPAGERMRVRENEDEGERRGRRERIAARARANRRRPRPRGAQAGRGQVGLQSCGRDWSGGWSRAKRRWKRRSGGDIDDMKARENHRPLRRLGHSQPAFMGVKKSADASSKYAGTAPMRDLQDGQ